MNEAWQQYHRGNLDGALAAAATVESLGGKGIGGALFLQGLVAEQAGEHSVAENFYRAAISFNPNKWRFHACLGMLLRRFSRNPAGAPPKGAIDEAAVEISRAAKLAVAAKDGGGKLAVTTCIFAARECKDVHEAEGILRDAVANLKSDQKLVAQLHYALGKLMKRNGKKNAAADAYRACLQSDPGHELARYKLAALQGGSSTLNGAPVKYVRALYDGYAEKFDQSLMKLKYSTPQLLAEMLRTVPCSFRHCLDLGCGTGLSGLAFAPIAERIHGVDLSPKMLLKAQERQIYYHLAEMGIVEYMEQHSQDKDSVRFDLFICADVLPYFGDIGSVLGQARTCAAPSAFFLLSTEALISDLASAEVSGVHFRLKETGRFQHSKEYIEKAAFAAGWKVVSTKQATLRQNKNLPVIGNLFLLQLCE
eukprot:g2950.t1